MLTGLSAIHKRNLIHRDIKLESILLKKDGNCPEEFPYRLMLENIGLAKQLSNAGQDAIAKASADQHTPPERPKDLGHSQQGDVLQLGIVFRSMLTGLHPFSMERLTQDIEGRRRQVQLPGSVD